MWVDPLGVGRSYRKVPAECPGPSNQAPPSWPKQVRRVVWKMGIKMGGGEGEMAELRTQYPAAGGWVNDPSIRKSEQQCRRPRFDPLVGKIPWRRA